MAARRWLGTAVRYARLERDDRRLILEAAVQLTRASLELRLAPSRRTTALLGTVNPGGEDDRVGAARVSEAARVGRTVGRVAGRLPWGPTCLRQALATQRMLRRRAIPNELHLGVTGGPEAAAHAWVTVDGEPVVGEQGFERYVPLAVFR